MSEAINYFSAKIHLKDMAESPKPIHLIGCSGGAAVAVLVAAMRCKVACDIASIRSAAGNLDTEAVNLRHGVSSMPQSINPISVADLVARIPQLHIVGAKDELISIKIAATFIENQYAGCAHILVVDGVSHEVGWLAHWQDLLLIQPSYK